MSFDQAGVLVIIPTYNRAEFITQAIQSTLDQDYPAVKTLVVDDGSTDGTRKVCLALQKQRSGHLEYLHQENQGCAVARNRGLEQLDASCGYVCFLDSDDRLLPGKLAREVELLEQHPEADFTYADSIIFDVASQQERVHRVAAAHRPDRFAMEHFLTNEAKCSAILYRAEVVRKRRFREDLKLNEDSEFLQRIAIECRGIYSSRPGCWVRWHAGSKSRNLAEIQKAVLRASEDILKGYPGFHASFQKQADARIKAIRKSLVRELMIQGRWDEARQYADRAAERLQIQWHLSAYLKFRRWVRSVLVNPG